MIVRQTEEFAHWLTRLTDARAKAKISMRLRRAERGNLGDIKPVGDGVSEMRIDHGPGYRLYFVQRGNVLVVLLCGGTKKGQAADIAKAKRLSRDLEP
jgi:putative addiction module killer protein